MSYPLDSNVISELRKGARADPNVAAWFSSVSGEEIFLSVLVLGEIRRGIERIRRRDPKGARALESWLARLVSDYADRVLPIDRDVAEEWGRLNVPKPVPVVNGLMAAIARIFDLTLVTRNVRDVSSTGVEFLDPWASL